jgi:plasmid stabilization system protein ParE
MRTYRLTNLARSDLCEIWNSVAHRSSERADRFLDEIRVRFQEIADCPLAPASEDIFYDTDHRIHKVCEFFIFYTPRDDRIEITRILESADGLNFW